MKNILLTLVLIGILVSAKAQNKTDVSLFLRADSASYLNELSSESGDLYTKVGHHGPAVENEWMALRLYFDHKAAIDVYNKTRPGLELKAERWYPSAALQKEGWGADYYKVGSTVGLGGVRLWDGEKVIELDPVSMRTARVVKERTSSYLEMLSEGVPYKGRKVDILVRVTVYSGIREAKVEAFALCDEPVQFATGINYHKGEELFNSDGLIVTWGLHPEDVAAETVKIGGAILYNPDDFVEKKDDGKEFLLISKPVKELSTWVSTACAREKDLNTMEKFKHYLEKLN